MNWEWFNTRVLPEPNSGCWLWIGKLNDAGYGTAWRDQRVHRLNYERFKGKIPLGLELDHLCRVRCCVNPDHLEAVTHMENCQRGDAGKSTGAQQRAKTYCPQGHEYSAENTYTYNGKRTCKECQRRRTRIHYEKAAQRVRRVVT